MRIKVLSDTALVIEVAKKPGIETLTKIRDLVHRIDQIGLSECQEIVPGLTAVAVHLKVGADLDAVRTVLDDRLSQAPVFDQAGLTTRERIVPVTYGGEFGPDLERVAGHTGLGVKEVIKRHSEGEYHVMALGFAPGFPYLSGLDATLACPRLDSPRLRVPAGAVAIGGNQTGVYPQELPGGWNIIGRTSQSLFDHSATEPAWLRVGDRVRFKPVEEQIGSVTGDNPSKFERTGPAVIEVESGGVQTTVQDLGRRGFQAIGVAEGGALNPRALSVANLLVGNPANTAALEWVLKGPVLKFETRTLVAITGSNVSGHPVGRPFWINAGETLDLSKLSQGGVGYLAIAGGFSVPRKLGSASTHLAAGFGGFAGRALQAGDRLSVGESAVSDVVGQWGIATSLVDLTADAPIEVRIIRGPESEQFSEDSWQVFQSEIYRTSPDSNRMGFRFTGLAIETADTAEMVSQPVARGTVQIPPSGQPVVLMADRQSVGGYPRMAAVISADIPKLASLPLGGAVRFVEVTLEEAQRARCRAARDLGLLEVGLRDRLVFKS